MINDNIKNVVIRQPAGLGDILFCQKIARLLADSGYNVIWPVIPQYEYIKEYLPEEFNFVPQNSDYPCSDSIINGKFIQEIVVDQKTSTLLLPLEKATYFRPTKSFNGQNYQWKDIFTAKYGLINILLNKEISYHDWADYVKIKRNKQREKYLESQIRLPAGHVFVNEYFASPPDIQKINIPITKLETRVDMRDLGFDRIFDWMGVLETAKQIHTVQTGLQFICETMYLDAVVKKIYQRTGMPNYDYLKGVFHKHNWEYI